MNGPKPVWMLATKRLSQSRARSADGDAVEPISRSCTRSETAMPRSLSSRRSAGPDRRRRPDENERPGLAPGLVFGRRLDLGAIETEHDRRVAVGGVELKEPPVDGDLAAADAEEAAEIDHGGAHIGIAIDEHFDDQPHVLARGVAHLLAKNGDGR